MGRVVKANDSGSLTVRLGRELDYRDYFLFVIWVVRTVNCDAAQWTERLLEKERCCGVEFLDSPFLFFEAPRDLEDFWRFVKGGQLGNIDKLFRLGF